MLDLGVDRNVLLKLIFKELCLGTRVKSFLVSPAMDFCNVAINLRILLKDIKVYEVFVNYQSYSTSYCILKYSGTSKNIASLCNKR